MAYPLVCVLRTDNDGSWSKENSEWGDMIGRMNISMYYVSPDRHADENGFAERACGILEVVVKSLLVQRVRRHID